MTTRRDIEIIEAERPEDDTPSTWTQTIANGLTNEYRRARFLNGEFVECDACFNKPGCPVLCAGCLANRDTISSLRAKR